jgi:flagellar hook-basal body complex protein FliE
MSTSSTALNTAISSAASAVAAPTETNGGFSKILTSAIDKVDDLQSQAEQKVTSMLAGNGEDIHSAALSVEKASLAFDLMLQVRNKVVNAYQEISRLQF